MQQNQILNFVIQNLAGAPSNPKMGQSYFDTTVGASFIYNGTGWVCQDPSKVTAFIPISALTVNPLARANHTGTQLSTTISDLAATVQGYSLDKFAVALANINLNGHTLTNLATPNAAGQAAEYSWVLNQLSSVAAGIKSIKDPVRVLFSTNQVLSGLPTTANADNVTLAAGDRVLLNGQATASQNGIWLVQTGAWTRPDDFNETSDIFSGTEVLVNEGTTYNGSVWRITTTGTITFGTTDINWTQVNKLNTYTNGNGLTLTGMQFSVQTVVGGGIISTASGIQVDTAVVARKYPFSMGDGSATSIVITHGLGTTDIDVTTRIAATNAPIELDWAATNANQVTFTFTSAPAANAFRGLITG
jgi:hypothetical protein